MSKVSVHRVNLCFIAYLLLHVYLFLSHYRLNNWVECWSGRLFVWAIKVCAPSCDKVFQISSFFSTFMRKVVIGVFEQTEKPSYCAFETRLQYFQLSLVLICQRQISILFRGFIAWNCLQHNKMLCYVSFLRVCYISLLWVWVPRILCKFC